MALKNRFRLRSYDPCNTWDVQLMNLMYYHPEVMKAKGYFREDFDFEKVKDIFDIDKNLARISKLSKMAKQVLYSVVDEANNLVGWIWFYHESRYPLPKKIRDELGLDENKSLIFQVSYQKLMSEGWPQSLVNKVSESTVVHLHKPRYGVIVEGLKMALVKLKQESRKLYNKRTIVIFAYVLPENIGSAKVLERNGFSKYHRQYKYEGELNNVWTLII